MNQKEIKALINLLDDEDLEVLTHVEEKIISLGESVIPILELEWEKNPNPVVQRKIEELIHILQFENLKIRLINWKDAGANDLLEGLWLVATYQYPDMKLETLRKNLDQLYYEVWPDFQPDLNPFDQVRLINNAIFSKLKFSANAKNFHSPSNSMINIVLESKKGNPISLCAVYMLIGRKFQMPLFGVNLPNLFILTYKTNDVQFYINAFNKGLIFTRAEIDSYIAQLNLPPSDVYYEPCSNLDIIKRMLRNLIISFEKTENNEKMEEVKTLLKSIASESEQEFI